MKPTPETDAFAIKFVTVCGEKYWVPADFARKLERELAEAREALAAEIKHHTETTAKWNGHHMDLTISQCDLNKAIRELDEAREALKHIEEYGTEEINAAVELRQKLASALVERDEAREALKHIEEYGTEEMEAGGDCPSAPCSAWVSVADRLPPAGIYVLVHLTKDNWRDSEDPQGVYNVVAKLRHGLSKADREKMKRGELPDPDSHGYIAPDGRWEKVTSKRSAVTKAEDEDENNLRPYNWCGFGNGKYWGQEVDYWMPIPSLPNAWVHGLGAEKYGPYNWRDTGVCATTYVAAIMRHLNAWRDGEDLDPESGISHIAHIACSCNILLDAQHCDTLQDDRNVTPQNWPEPEPNYRILELGELIQEGDEWLNIHHNEWVETIFDSGDYATKVDATVYRRKVAPVKGNTLQDDRYKKHTNPHRGSEFIAEEFGVETGRPPENEMECLCGRRLIYSWNMGWVCEDCDI